MGRKSGLALAIILLLSLSSPVYAAAPKAGSKCTKAGITATLAGKKYTCIKSGKNLVWNKGVVIPVVTKAPEVEVKNLLSSDSRITPTSDLTSLEVCKTVDKTPDYVENGLLLHKNGFPRPTQSAAGKKSAKALVIPLSFTDLPFRKEKYQRAQLFTSDLDMLTETIPLVKESYKKLSAGRFDITIDVLPESDWWVINSEIPFSSTWGVDNFGKIEEIIDKYKKDYKFDSYDTYIFITGNGVTGQQGLGAGQAARLTSKNAKSGSFNTVLMAGGYNNTTLWVHELGHALFYLEDLYLFSEAKSQTSGTLGIKDMNVPNKWDLMADSSRGILLEWNKYLMGWIYDSEVRCLSDQSTSIHYLSDVDTSTDPKLLTINLAPGVTLAAEVRNATGVDKGLLLYIINSYVSHGEGPILTQNTLLAKGQTKGLYGWEFSVLDTNAMGLLVSVKKTDIDKFVVPAEKPVQNQPSQPQSSIIVRKGEILPNGSLKAQATWDVSGYESYRLYVTDVVDFQKVYFESGYVNDSRNPLVIDISGLVCNKEFRTVTEFYSKKNGEGERQVIQSLQLRNLPCP